jgi:hypothetical protein
MSRTFYLGHTSEELIIVCPLEHRPNGRTLGVECSLLGPRPRQQE